jgi:ATP-dependent Lhr-like helicase
MARPSKPWYRTSKDAWFVKILESELLQSCGGRLDHDALAISVECAGGVAAVESAVRELGPRDPSSMTPYIDEMAIEGLKFSSCLPKAVATVTLASRLRDTPAISTVLAQRLRHFRGI